MAVTGIMTNHFKYQLAMKQIDLDLDSIKALLMRDGFVFNRDEHAAKKNIKTNSGAISITFSAAAKTITRTSGSFITDGFVAGNKITTDATLNPGPFTITNVTALVITVSEAVADEGPVTKTVTSDDELSTGNGYTQDTKTLANTTVTEDDTNDRAEMSADDVSWTASGGAIGPTPGAILYDDTSPDDTIIGYLDFGGNQSAASGANFTITTIRVRI
jgi:hypothetical protein